MNPKPLLLTSFIVFLLLFFSRCAKDLERLDLASNLQVILNVKGVNNLDLEAELKNLGSFEVVNQGFLFSYASFGCEDPANLVSDVRVTINDGQDFEFEATIPSLELGRAVFVRAFVEVIHPITKERRRVCSELPTRGVTGELSLRGGSEELVDKTIQLNAKLNGLVDGVIVQDHGFFWLTSDERLLDLPSPQFVIDTVESQIEHMGPLSENGDFKVKKKFDFGIYYYAMPFIVFDGKTIFDPDGYQEIFIGDFWVEIANDTMIPGLYPEYLAEGASFVIGDYAYIGTGNKVLRNTGDRFLTSTFWRYDPINNAYERLADYPGSAEGRRRQAVGFALNGKGYVGTGHNNMTQFAEFYEYTPEINEWRRVQDFPILIRSAVSFVIEDYAYVGTGFNCQDRDGSGAVTSDECSLVRDLYRFDPKDATEVDSLGRPMGKWEKMASLQEGANRRSAVGFALNGIGYIATGVLSNGHSRALYAYNPVSNNWERKTDMPGIPRQKAAVFGIGNQAYIIAGTNASISGTFPTLNDLWKYYPETDTWQQGLGIFSTNLDSGIPFTFKGKAYIYGGYTLQTFQSISHYVRVYTPEKAVFESAQ